MSIVYSMLIAFGMYSKIPMKQLTWNEKNMRYSLCFFPVVGITMGAMLGLLYGVMIKIHLSPALGAAFLTAFPIWFTGGFHLDGFLDTCDAKASYGTMEKKHEILKDSHVGAFALIHGCLFFLLSYGAWQALLSENSGGKVALVFCLLVPGITRGYSGLSLVTRPMANKKGTAAFVSDKANKKIVKGCLAGGILLGCVLLVYTNPCMGGILCLGELLSYLWYCRFSRQNFGGVTGDLAGNFLCTTELICLLLCALGKVGRLW